MTTVRIGDITEQIRGVTFSKGDAISTPRDGYVPVLTAVNIQDSRLITRNLTYVPAARVGVKQLVQKHDVVVCASSGSLNVVGKAAQSDGTFTGGFGAFLKVLRPSAGVDPQYFAHFFQTTMYRRVVSSQAAGANINNLRNEHLDDLTLLLPSLPEQRRIAAILDRAEVLRARLHHVLAHLDALKLSIYTERFGSTKHTTRLSNFVDEFRYGTSSKSGNTGSPTLRIPNVVGGGITTNEIKTVEVGPSELRRLALTDGDLLFVRTNGNPDNVGRSALFSRAAVASAGFGDQTWIFASYLIRARLAADAVPAFVSAYLATQQGRKQLRERAKTSAGQYNINIESLSSILIPAPPVAKQLDFAASIEAIGDQQHRLRAAVMAADELFASLQSRAFRGEL